MIRVEILDVTNACDDLIYMAARQCYNEGSIIDMSTYDSSDVAKLIKHCQNSGHHTVLEHAKVTFAIDGISRALSHQLVRHRIASYSQQSQRYAGIGEGGFVIPMTVRENPKAKMKFDLLLEDIGRCYKELIGLDIPAEDARMVLPNATITRIVVTMNFRALLHFFEERLCKCAQWEIRDLAKQMLKAVKDYSIVFNEAGPKCERLGYCPESSKRWCGRKPLKKTFFSALDELSKLQKELETDVKDMYDYADQMKGDNI